MVTLDMKGRTLDVMVAYKVGVLIRKDTGNEEGSIKGKWKMSVTQEIKLAQLYTNVLVQNFVPEGEPLVIKKKNPVMFGGHEVLVVDDFPDTEVHFLGEDMSILAKVVNLSADLNRGVEHDVVRDKIEHHFKSHKVSDEAAANMNLIREACKQAALVIVENTPICADQTAAIRHLEDAMFNANAAIARGGK